VLPGKRWRKLDLPTTQREIASDWIAAYRKHFSTDKPLPLGSDRIHSSSTPVAHNAETLLTEATHAALGVDAERIEHPFHIPADHSLISLFCGSSLHSLRLTKVRENNFKID
jgi:hypothetical protein